MKNKDFKYSKAFLIPAMFLFIAITFGFLFYDGKKNKPANPENENANNQPVVTEETFQNYSSDVDAPTGYVVVKDKDFLNSERDEYLSDYALLSLQEYLNRYISFYLEVPDDEILEATYVKKSYKGDINSPSFKLSLSFGNEKILIDCIFDSCQSRYFFFSSLS